MLPYKTLISIHRNISIPVCLQIANGLTIAIRKGIIPTGSRLPGTRILAETLGVHRKTVVSAFDELYAQGWIEVVASKGTYVSLHLPESKATPIVEPVKPQTDSLEQTGYPLATNTLLDSPYYVHRPGKLALNDGFPDIRLAPISALNRAYHSILKRGIYRHYLSYSDVNGNPLLRQVLSEYLNETRGLQTGPQNIFISRGSQMAIYLVSNVLLSPNDVVVVGETNYWVADMVFIRTGAKLHRVPVDAHGISVDHIESLCQQQKIRAVFVTSHHHPTTVTLRSDRRVKLLQLAEQYGFAIIEDDYDYDFHYQSSPILPLASADTHGMVIYIGSMCKLLAPAIRVGYIAGPVNLMEEITKFRRIIDRQGDPILEQAVAELIREGDIKRHLKKSLRVYQQRRDLFCQLLTEKLGEAIQFKIPDGGMAVWAKLDPALQLTNVSQKAAVKGLHMSNGLIYDPGKKGLNGSRWGFASLDTSEIEQVVDILTQVVKR
jgi:GntR family transcriptional regulator/MocR family aminotransferase